MEFYLREKPIINVLYGRIAKAYEVWATNPKSILISRFIENGGIGFLPEGCGYAMAGDYVDFLNEKYLDKKINAEWKGINIEGRIEYHENQIKRHKSQLDLLKSGKYLCWSEHGNEVVETTIFNI